MFPMFKGVPTAYCKSTIRKQSHGSTDVEVHILGWKCYCQEAVYVNLHTPLQFLELFDPEEEGTKILEKSVTIYRSTWRNIPGDWIPNLQLVSRSDVGCDKNCSNIPPPSPPNPTECK